jgi:hypothetical protein
VELRYEFSEVPHGTRRDDDFERRLRLEVDENLRLRWSDQKDRWIIFRVSHLNSEKWEPIRILENAETREYIPLDDRVIQQARAGDTWRRPRGAKDILDEIQEANAARTREHDERRRAAAQDAATYIEKKAAGVVTSLPKAKPIEKPGRIIIARG